MKLFFDTEFTGLHQATTLISLGIVAEDGRTFYAEFTDYDKSQVNDWLQKHIIDNLRLINHHATSGGHEMYYGLEGKKDRDFWSYECFGKTEHIKNCLLMWLEQFDSVEFWSDCLAYDWVLLNGLISDYSKGYPELPKNVHYIPFDICTMFKLAGIDPDISREEYSGMTDAIQHNALDDARMIKACWGKCVSERSRKRVEE